jgi:hypothetical protein
MLNLIFNILGFALFVLILVGAFWISAVFVLVLGGVFLAAFIGLKIWAYLVAKKIVNPRPGYPADPGVIDAEFTRVDVRIEERKE